MGDNLVVGNPDSVDSGLIWVSVPSLETELKEVDSEEYSELISVPSVETEVKEVEDLV